LGSGRACGSGCDELWPSDGSCDGVDVALVRARGWCAGVTVGEPRDGG
jgi:hypothetical protein